MLIIQLVTLTRLLILFKGDLLRQKSLWVLCWSLLLSFNLYAKTIVDVYGVTPRESADILAKYAHQVINIENLLEQQVDAQYNSAQASKKLIQLIKQKQQLIQTIKQHGKFAFVNFQTIYYPNKSDQYVTIEIIKPEQKSRLKWIMQAPQFHSFVLKNDLIQQMIQFKEMNLHLLLTKQLPSKMQSCPVYHCISDFKHPQLKPYLQIFNRGVIKQRKLILATIQHDPDPDRRTAAALLIGHFHSPRDIVQQLLPHLTDPDDGVRNSVIRVLSMTTDKAHLYDIDALPFIALLDSPYETDRNKTMYMLSSLVKNPTNKRLILQHARETLIALLQLKQPNNHDLAYSLLQTISGKNFDEYDIQAWQAWSAHV